MSSLYFSAVHKSSGKTTLAIALAAEARRRALSVRPFKKGPDYIDPMWLGLAAGQACYNLDFHTMSPSMICAAFAQAGQGADLCLVEGNVGLYDSVDLHGAGSNAELVKLLGTPLVLVIDAKGLGRGIAPLLLGFQTFDPQLHIAGVILNRTGGERHSANLRRVVEYYTDIPVLGLLPRLAELDIDERHLGLMPSTELDGAEQRVEHIRARVAEHVDCDALLQIAADATPSEGLLAGLDFEPTSSMTNTGSRVRIGVARDAAFGFYYPDDLAALERAGADLIDFSPLASSQLPAVDALLLGGGFPEFYLETLADNRALRAAIADFVAAGRPVYAECGGLMYLCRQLHWGERSAPMCGVLQADVAMHERPQGRGYVRLQETGASPWPGGDQADIMAHEFHHSAVVHPDPDWHYAYRVLRGAGVDGCHDGIVVNRLLASYAHLRGVGGNAWPARFVAGIQAALD